MSGGTRKRIPIPSFSTSLEQEEAPSATPTSQEERYTNIPLNKQWLLQLEGALQLFLHQKQHNQKRQSISYSEFCALVPKLVLEDDDAPPPPSTTTSNSENDESSSPVSDLSKEERLWHDWYCVAVPTLYKVVVANGSSTLRVLELERVPFDGNRWKEARRLVEDTLSKGGVRKNRSNEAIQMLQSLRSTDTVATTTTTKDDDDNNKKHKKQPPPEDSSSIDLLLLKPEMNLEERVRARAQRREKQLQKVEEARRDPKDDWLAVADVLFSHACHLLRKQQRLETAALLKKQPPNMPLNQSKEGVTKKKCVLTFPDVVRVLPDRSRQEITAILQGIAQTCPGWMGWIDPKTNTSTSTTTTTTTTSKGEKTNDVPILSKRATVWIETSDYKKVRAQLLKGENNKLPPASSPTQITSQQPPVVEEKKPTTVTVTKQPSVVPTMQLQSSSTAKRTAEAVHTRHNKRDAPNGKRTAAEESPQPTNNKRLRVNFM